MLNFKQVDAQEKPPPYILLVSSNANNDEPEKTSRNDKVLCTL